MLQIWPKHTDSLLVVLSGVKRPGEPGDRVDQATKPPARVRHYLKVHFRNAPDRDEFAKLVGQEIYDHTRELDFPKVEDVVIDVAPVVDHDNQLLADAQAQWIQFCESHPFHPPVKLAQIQMAMLLAMYRLYQNIAPSLPPPAVAQTMSPRRGSGQKIGGESAGKAPRPLKEKKRAGWHRKGPTPADCFRRRIVRRRHPAGMYRTPSENKDLDPKFIASSGPGKQQVFSSGTL